MDIWDIQSWFSLATETGLSIMSLGVPGLRSEVDEQVFTGGVTAMQAMFTAEIGAETESFIGGGKTSKVGRFAVSVDRAGKKVTAIAQFLLVSRVGADIPEPLIIFSRDLVVELSEHIMRSDDYNETSLDQIEIPVVADPFIQIVENLRKKYKKLPSQNQRLIPFVQAKVRSALISYEFSEALRAISQQSSLKPIQEKQRDYLNRFAIDIFNSILADNPTIAILHGHPKKIKEEINQFIQTSVKEIAKTVIVKLKEISNEYIEQEMSEILSTFGKADIREKRDSLQEILHNKVLRHVIRNYPLLVLVNPSLSVRSVSLGNIISEITSKIIFEYDKGGILSKISENLMPSPSGELTGVFIRSFTGSFTLGLSDPGWLFISWLLNDLSKTHKIKIEKAVKELEVPDSQKESILTNLNSFSSEFKGRGKKDLTFSLSTIGDAKTLIDSLELSLTRAFSYYFQDAFLSKQKGLGTIPRDFAMTLGELGRGAQWTYVALQVISFLCNKNWEVFSPYDNIPLATDLEAASQDYLSINTSWNSDNISYFWYSPSRILEACHTRLKSVITDNLSLIKNELMKTLDHIEELENGVTKFFDNPLKVSPMEVSPLEFAPLRPLHSKIGKKIEKELYNGAKQAYDQAIRDYLKLLQPIWKARKQVIDRKKKVSHLEKQIQKSRSSPAKIRSSFVAVKQKIEDGIKKEQKGILQKLERELKRVERDLSKVISEARFYAFKTSSIDEGYSIISPSDTLTMTWQNIRQFSLDPIVGDLFEIPHLYFGTRILRRLFYSTEEQILQMLAFKETSNMLEDIITSTRKEGESLLSNLRARLSQYSQRTLYDDIIQFPLHEIKQTYLNEDPAIIQSNNSLYLEIGRLPRNISSNLTQFSEIVGEDVLATVTDKEVVVSLKLPFTLE
ncbi:MAG: hypothetical protein ACFFDT_14305, partial [Candidatus Hodarchaeota archaeon]